MQCFKIAFFICMVAFFSTACQTVKPYQRVYLNDAEMQMNKDATGKFEEKVQDIREGAAPSGGAYKTGGCGCN